MTNDLYFFLGIVCLVAAAMFFGLAVAPPVPPSSPSQMLTLLDAEERPLMRVFLLPSGGVIFNEPLDNVAGVRFE